MIGSDVLQGDTQPDTDAALAQHAHGRGAQLLPHFGHHLFGQIQQHEFDVGRVEAHLFRGGIGQGPQLHGEFGPRVGRTDDDDRPPGRGPLGIVVDIGQFELLEHVVTQIERLGGRLQPARVDGEPGHVEEAGDGTRRQHQAIPRHGAGSLFGIGERHGAPLEIDRVHPCRAPPARRAACAPAES